MDWLLIFLLVAAVLVLVMLWPILAAVLGIGLTIIAFVVVVGLIVWFIARYSSTRRTA